MRSGAANRAGLPVLVAFGLMADYPEANLRHYRFMLEGLREVEEALARRRIGWSSAAARRPRSPWRSRAMPRSWSLTAAICATRRPGGGGRRARAVRGRRGRRRRRGAGRGGVRQGRGRRAHAAAEAASGLGRLSQAAARRWPSRRRRSICRSRARSICPTSRACSAPEARPRGRAGAPLSGRHQRGATASGAISPRQPRRLCRGAQRARGVSVQPAQPVSAFRADLAGRDRARRARRAAGAAADRRSYLEELIVRRELAVNFVNFEPDYDRYDCLPGWARATLADHRSDRRARTLRRGRSWRRRQPTIATGTRRCAR